MALWGGNYDAAPDRGFWTFNASLPFDRRLLPQEIAASRAYGHALARCGALREQDRERLDAALAAILDRVRAEPALVRDSAAEDVHSFVEEQLALVVGDLASQLHLGRSRNEQAVTALRLFVRESIDGLRDRALALARTLAESGLRDADALLPGYTHTRAAEPITFGHWAGAHAWGVLRDAERLADARRRVDVLPLGSGALAGTALPIDRDALARDLGFAAVSENALDAVMDRDFAAEFLFCCAQAQTHLSRLAEDLIWLSGPEYGFFLLPDAFTTGSSLMPQKKNPDALELVRGKAARVDAAALRMLILMKGLPAGYQKDLQEDKEAVFDGTDAVAGSLEVTAGVVAGLRLDRDAMARAAARPEMLAAGLAVAIARTGMPFRSAHSLVGTLVADAARAGETFRETALRVLPVRVPALAASLSDLLDPAASVRSKSARGGTAPDAVRASLERLLERARATS